MGHPALSSCQVDPRPLGQVPYGLEMDARPLGPPLAYVFRGFCRSRLADSAAWIQDYDKAIGLAPDNAVYHVSRGAAKAALKE